MKIYNWLVLVFFLVSSVVYGQDLTDDFKRVVGAQLHVEPQFRTSASVDTIYMRYLTFIPIEWERDKILVNFVLTDRSSKIPTSYIVHRPQWISQSMLPNNSLQNIVVPIRFCVNCSRLESTSIGAIELNSAGQTDPVGYTIYKLIDFSYRRAH